MQIIHRKVRAVMMAGSLSMAALPMVCGQDSASPNPSPITATVDATKVSAPISPYLYGMFIEHLGTLINHGLWSEMLDDRKFFFPITSSDDVSFPNDEKSEDANCGL